MITKKTPAPDGNREAGYGNASDNTNHTPIRTRLKAAIINLAVWGLIPAGLATWSIQCGGLNDV